MGAKNNVIRVEPKGLDPLTCLFVTALATIVLVGICAFSIGTSMAQVAVVDCPVQPDVHRRIDAAQAWL